MKKRFVTFTAASSGAKCAPPPSTASRRDSTESKPAPTAPTTDDLKKAIETRRDKEKK